MRESHLWTKAGWCRTRLQLIKDTDQLRPSKYPWKWVKIPSHHGYDTLWLFNIAMEAMAHRNRWFTYLKIVIFSMAMLNNQMVYYNMAYYPVFCTYLESLGAHPQDISLAPCTTTIVHGWVLAEDGTLRKPSRISIITWRMSGVEIRTCSGWKDELWGSALQICHYY